MTDNVPNAAILETAVEPEDPALLLRRLAFVALLAILLGFVMQGLILAAKLASGGVFPATRFS